MNRSISLAALLCACTAACSADRPTLGQKDMTITDADTSEILPPPSLGNIPLSTPRSTVALLGTSAGSRIVILGGSSSTETTVFPSGTFCADVPLSLGQTNHLQAIALGDGKMSEAASAEVTQDANASDPAMPSCSGQGGSCGTSEICGNGIDDDCNGLLDDCDPQCNGCIDDFLEPNDYPFNAPTLTQGNYSNLQLCPCRTDWYAFSLGKGQTLNVHIAGAMLNLALFRAADAPKPQAAPVAFTSNFSDLTWSADEAGTYDLHVSTLGTSPIATYTLTVQ